MLRAILIPFALALLGAGFAAEEPAASTAPDESFAIVLVSSDGESKHDDVLILSGGTLSSQGYAESRFQPGKLILTGKDGARRFEATMVSPRGAEAIWSGTITGDAVEGKVLTGVKGRFDASTFSGTRKK
jgi:hypothetical protein